MPKGRYLAGVDLGGTWIRVALSDEKGSFIDRLKERVDTSSEVAISDQIIKLVRLICSRNGISSKRLSTLGIASAGPMNLREGVLVKPPNLPFEFIPITEPVSKKLGVTVRLVNDCTAAVLAERKFGAGRGLDNLVYVTISTGIGGGAIVDGHLLFGKDGNAVEVGHFTVDSEGKLKCGCGRRGHWEAYCSGRNIPNFVRMRFGEIEAKRVKQSLLFRNVKGRLSRITSKGLFDMAKIGDDLSLQIVEEIGELNAVGFADITNAYDPSLIAVGGSVALNNEKLLLYHVKKGIKAHAINRAPKIILTPLGEDVSLYGAIAVVLTQKI